MNYTCLEPECDQTKIMARGLCNRHYLQHRSRGTIDSFKSRLDTCHVLSGIDPETRSATCTQCGPTFVGKQAQGERYQCRAVCAKGMPPGPPEKKRVGVSPGMSDQEKFEHYGWTLTDSGCWEWAGCYYKTGYGATPHNSFGTRVAHRVSYMIYCGPIDPGITIHHICANRACVNPLHLQPLSGRLNTAEMFERKTYKKRIATLERDVRDLKRENRKLTKLSLGEVA